MNDSSNQEQAYAELLSGRLAQAQAQRQALLTAIAEMRSARRLTSADDEHDPEGSTVSLDQARDTALLARVEHSVAELTAAQQRLKAGVFGRCESCEREITPARLEARPEARLCLPCSSARQARR